MTLLRKSRESLCAVTLIYSRLNRGAGWITIFEDLSDFPRLEEIRIQSLSDQTGRLYFPCLFENPIFESIGLKFAFRWFRWNRVGPTVSHAGPDMKTALNALISCAEWTDQ